MARRLSFPVADTPELQKRSSAMKIELQRVFPESVQVRPTRGYPIFYKCISKYQYHDRSASLLQLNQAISWRDKYLARRSK